MYSIRNIWLIIFCPFLMFSQFPVDLQSDETISVNYQIESSSEYLIDLTLSSNTNWSQAENESAVLTLIIDDNIEKSQDVIVYNGDQIFTYQHLTGFLDEGEHVFEFIFNYNKSSIGAEIIHIESVNIIPSYLIDIDSDIFTYSPIMYGRNIFSWNESNHTDIPIMMFYELEYWESQMNEEIKSITYNIIFSNEDSRIGSGLSEMMMNWGRTTDIEWMYNVNINSNGDIVSEYFQGAGHITTEFEGSKIDNHPLLINATPNCNYSDVGTSDYRFFLSPHNSVPDGHTNEILMDQNPWMYKIMAEELINENKYEDPANSETLELSDVRNYLYLEYNGSEIGSDIELVVSVQFYNDCSFYSNDHNLFEIVSGYSGGVEKTSIELEQNFDSNLLKYLQFTATGSDTFSINITDIYSVFYLSESYIPVEIMVDDLDTPIVLDSSTASAQIILGGELHNIDCTGLESGEAYCDECGVCSSGNTGIDPNLDMDECGVCFGFNSDMDCLGDCFGNALEDACGECDSDPLNDGESCNAGCTDLNATNFDEYSQIQDDSCEYSDNIFHVPAEYDYIQDAIFFASTGDTVLVSAGEYFENIDFLGKDIIVTSVDGIENTIINGNGNGTVVLVNKGETNSAKLEGFTIINGNGVGVSFEYFISYASNIEAYNNMIVNDMKAGGITVINSSITLSNLNIVGNTSRNVGGGIELVNSNAVLDGLFIHDNYIPEGDALGGGGIAINGGEPYIVNCVISDNFVGSNLYQLNGGGAIMCGFNVNDTPMNLQLRDVQITNNSANIGAGLGILSGNVYLDKVLISDNIGDYGSAISLGEPLGLVIDNISMIVTNSTISNNVGQIAIGLTDNSNFTLINSIVWNDGVFEFTTLPNNSELNVNAFYSDIQILDGIIGQYNINENPQFVGDYENGYQLYLDSPCVDSGTDYFEYNGDVLVNLEPTEFSGIAPDMGVFETNFYYGLGDVNHDMVLDIQDIVIIVSYIIDSSNQIDFEMGDFNQDSVINVLDIISIVNVIMNFN